MSTRSEWIDLMSQIVYPVIVNGANDTLREKMPLKNMATRGEQKEICAVLEAVGRTLVGIAPWLEGKSVGEEEILRANYADLSRKTIANLVDETANDYGNFDGCGTFSQPLVDAAFLAEALLNAKQELYYKQPIDVQQNIVKALKKVRVFRPGNNNWTLFAAMIETFLYAVGEPDFDIVRIDYAMNMHEERYVGDGFYKDGANFSFDYYNSFVIQPMMVDIVNTIDRHYDSRIATIKSRASHYATILENLIAPDGSFPVTGRSMCYRFGAFQALAHAALFDNLEKTLLPQQVRTALDAVLKRVMAYPNFDVDGWLEVGFCGIQPQIADDYISTGSLYLCSTIFLPLGLPETHAFWSATAMDWTGKKIWNGIDTAALHKLAKDKY